MDLAFKIEKNVPMGGGRKDASLASKLPLNDMEIGDSIHVPLSAYSPRNGSAPSVEGLRWTIVAAARAKGVKVNLRKEMDGFRIWRSA